MGNLAANTKAGDATAIGLVSVSLVCILLLLAAVAFLIIKVKQLSDSVKSNSSGGDLDSIVSAQQKKKRVV
jgi:hypothetical protein